MPLWCGNHWAGVVRVTSITQFRARQFSSPYTVYRLPSPALYRYVDIVDIVDVVDIVDIVDIVDMLYLVTMQAQVSTGERV